MEETAAVKGNNAHENKSKNMEHVVVCKVMFKRLNIKYIYSKIMIYCRI